MGTLAKQRTSEGHLRYSTVNHDRYSKGCSNFSSSLECCGTGWTSIKAASLDIGSRNTNSPFSHFLDHTMLNWSFFLGLLPDALLAAAPPWLRSFLRAPDRTGI